METIFGSSHCRAKIHFTMMGLILDSTSDKLVTLEVSGQVALLTLNRPQRHNSLVPALLEELLANTGSVAREPGVRAVVFQANGRSFSTGGDVAGFYEHLDNLATYSRRIVGLLNQSILSLLALPVPIVAAVHGQVTGGSLGLVLACDVVLMSPEASFTPYYSVVGFSPDGGWTAMLPEIIGHKRTAEILLHNRTISAEQAVQWGIAGQIVLGGQIRAAALESAQDIAAKKAGSISRSRYLLRDHSGQLASRLAHERDHFVQQITTPEARQGILAFLGK